MYDTEVIAIAYPMRMGTLGGPTTYFNVNIWMGYFSVHGPGRGAITSYTKQFDMGHDCSPIKTPRMEQHWLVFMQKLLSEGWKLVPSPHDPTKPDWGSYWYSARFAYPRVVRGGS